MSKGQLSKVMKFELRYEDGCGNFHTMQKEVWALQRQTREILNKTVQEAFHWDYISRQHFNETGAYLDILSETGYKTPDGYIYSLLKGQYPAIAASNLNCTLQKAWKKYKDAKPDVWRGTSSLPSYKSDQPLSLHKATVKLTWESEKACLTVLPHRLRRCISRVSVI